MYHAVRMTPLNQIDGELFMKNRIICACLAAVLLFTGCSTNKPAGGALEETSVSEKAIETTQTETAVTETTKEAEKFVFKRHVHTNLLSQYVTEDMWQSLYNLMDAIYEGADTFECSDKKAYDWCINDTVIGTFLPPVCMFVEGGGFENGTGKIKYKMDKDKLKERIGNFEKEVERMLNEAIRSDYSDFEKVMGLYAYICKNFVYDYNPLDGQGIDDFSDYACLMKKNGICCEIAGAYSYLLMQCDVEATSMGGDGTAGFHSWTYVVINGQGYHVDATWGLYGDFPNGVLNLQYFMLTEAERAMDFEKEIKPDYLWPWVDECDMKKFPAADDSFKEMHDGNAMFKNMDTEKNTITYISNGSEVTFSYGDM